MEGSENKSTLRAFISGASPRGRDFLTRARFQKLLLTSLKGRILDRLRHAPQTVDQLATSLGVTGNAVRRHLAALESDGLVRRGDPQKTTRRPSHTYRL